MNSNASMRKTNKPPKFSHEIHNNMIRDEISKNRHPNTRKIHLGLTYGGQNAGSTSLHSGLIMSLSSVLTLDANVKNDVNTDIMTIGDTSAVMDLTKNAVDINI